MGWRVPLGLSARGAALGVLLLLAAGCGDELSDRRVVDAAVPAVDAAAYGGEPLDWRRVRAAIEPDGLTRALSFELSPERRVFALRAYPDARGDVLSCFALRDVTVNGAYTWVGADDAADNGDYCTACEQRVSIGSGYGFFVLPSAASADLPISTVSARIGLRDCLTLTPLRRSADSPAELWVELAGWEPPDSARALRLSLAVLVASQFGLPDPEFLAAALDTLQQIWGEAGIVVTAEPSLEIAAPESPVVYSAVDHEALLNLTQRAHSALTPRVRDASWPVMILAPCLRREDIISGGRSEPWALTQHLPGGAAVGGEHDPIFIAAERCEGLSPSPRFDDPALLGTVMAHELGHYLGLYHVQENDGRQDALSDTDVSEPNLMQATPSAATTTLRASQIAIVRRHSAFAASP